MKDQETIIIDVREPMEFALGHVNGAINVPLSNLSTKVGWFRNLNKPAILYCRSGNRSGQAVMFLKAHGVERLTNGGSQEDVEAMLVAQH